MSCRHDNESTWSTGSIALRMWALITNTSTYALMNKLHWYFVMQLWIFTISWLWTWVLVRWWDAEVLIVSSRHLLWPIWILPVYGVSGFLYHCCWRSLQKVTVSRLASLYGYDISQSLHFVISKVNTLNVINLMDLILFYRIWSTAFYWECGSVPLSAQNGANQFLFTAWVYLEQTSNHLEINISSANGTERLIIVIGSKVRVSNIRFVNTCTCTFLTI